MKKALLTIILILMGCFVGCGPQYNTLYLRDDLQTFCRENDAVVLASSYFLPTGKIYYFEKQDGQWRKSQVLDLVPYLKEDFSNWHTVHINDDCKRNDDYKKNWLVYNDRWLVVTIRKSSAGNVNDTMRDYRGKAIIFKKIDSVWKHYYTLTSKEFFVYAKCVALTDFDQLIVSDPFKRTGEFKGIVRCFDLTGNKPRLVQELRPLESNCTTNERTGDYFPTPRFGKDFYVNKNVLIIGNGKDVPSNSINPQVNYLIYRLKNGCWEYACSLIELIPPEVYNEAEGIPLNGVTGINFQESEILLQNARYFDGGLLFRLNGEDCKYEQGMLIDTPWREETPCIQKPFVYTLAWRGKRERFALAKPSSDGQFRVVEPDWIVEDADPTTNQLVSDYFRYDFNTEYSKDHGYNSFYEFTDYVPSVDYAISGTTLVTSYFFEDCYFPNNPMQKAEVWGGVNIYEIDPEKGPVKKFALTTRNLEELKEVPLNAETPEEEKPFDSKILDKYFK